VGDCVLKQQLHSLLTDYYIAVTIAMRYIKGESNMTLRITTLSENTAGSGEFLGEWGLSILLETGDAFILFDSGKSLSLIFMIPRLVPIIGLNLYRSTF